MLEILCKAKSGDHESIMYIIDMLEPIIGKYEREGKIEDVRQELQLVIMETINKMPYCKNRGAFINYMSKTLFHEYLKMVQAKRVPTTTFDETYIKDHKKITMEDKIVIRDSIDRLTKNQKEIIKKVFYGGYTCVDIANDKGVTRQAITKTKNLALSKLNEVIT